MSSPNLDARTESKSRESDYPDAPVLANVWRAGHVESVHRGAWCLVDSSGGVIEESGPIEHPFFARSSIKCLQALPLLETGAAAHFGLTEEEVVLAVSSHNAEPCHVDTARGLLERLGLGEDDLGCGPQPPGDHAARAALTERGAEPGRLYNNCSGKHAGFLALTRYLEGHLEGHVEGGVANYLAFDSPSQVLVRQAVSDMTGIGSDALGTAIDGCSAPTFRMPLTALGMAFARFTNPDGLAPERRAACERVLAAVRANPVLLAGRSKRLDTALVQVSRGALFPKIGAEAVYVVGVPGRDRALAVKVDDGGLRGVHSVVVELLRRFGLLDDSAARALTRYRQQTLRNWDGIEVGRIEVL